MRTSPYRPLDQHNWQQIRGAVSLAGTSFERVTLRVQQMHLRIADVTFRNLAMAPVVNVGAAAFRPLHHGVTNGIYRIVRGVGGVAFKALDLALAGVARSQNPPLAARAIPAPVISAVNGAFGDYLLCNRNPLALRMGFYQNGKPLAMRTAALQAHHAQLSGKLVVFVHGLCCDESSWQMFRKPPLEDNKPYGEQLQALGYTPFYLRYNTGLKINQNGRMLSHMLGKLCRAYPQPIEQIVLIGHSMGGLVSRSAIEHGMQHKAEWTRHLSHLFCLGSPHLGAPLEKAVHIGTAVLGAFSVTQPLADMIDDRSIGIQNLRHGHSSHPQHDASVPTRPPHSHFHFIGSSMGRGRDGLISQLVGDGLVRLDSATPGDVADDITELEKVHHMQLLNHPQVFAAIAGKLGVQPLKTPAVTQDSASSASQHV